MEIFNVAWTKKRFGKSNIRMTKNDRKVFFAKGAKVSGIGKGYAFSSSMNFEPGSDDCQGVLIFRAGTLWRRLLMLGEDEIRVSQYGQWIRLEGIRRGVARAAYRLESFIERRRNE